MTNPFCLATLLLALFVSAPALAAIPPFELVQKSLAQAREGEVVSLDYRVTVTGKAVRDYELRGSAQRGESATLVGEGAPKLASDAKDVGFRLLWTALLSVDPVTSISADFGWIKSDATEVGVAQDFVYIYGTSPRVAVDRDLRRLVWAEVQDSGVKWRVELAYRDERVVGATVTKGGVPYISVSSRGRQAGIENQGD